MVDSRIVIWGWNFMGHFVLQFFCEVKLTPEHFKEIYEYKECKDKSNPVLKMKYYKD